MERCGCGIGDGEGVNVKGRVVDAILGDSGEGDIDTGY